MTQPLFFCCNYALVWLCSRSWTQWPLTADAVQGGWWAYTCVHVFFSLHSLVEMHTMNTILGLHDLNEFRRVDRGTHCLDRLFVCLSLP